MTMDKVISMVTYQLLSRNVEYILKKMVRQSGMMKRKSRSLHIATETEGIFRLAGSEKRIKELKVSFNSPDKYGKNLDWIGYTVHDAANILRRYFNQLPEPIVPLSFYEKFRDPIRNLRAHATSGNSDQLSVGADQAIQTFQTLITQLPSLNRQLLLYILDLLAVFASKSESNKMTTSNLAAIFQPGILSHPQHAMAPEEYKLSQDVLIFLIENQDHFLIGMHGTAADEGTIRDVQRGYQSPNSATADSPTNSTRAKTGLGRSASTASKGTERQFSSLRRNVSTSSRASPSPSLRSSANPLAYNNVHGSSINRTPSLPGTRKVSGSNSPVIARSGSVVHGSHNTATTARPQKLAITSIPSQAIAQTLPTAVNITSASSSEATTPLASTQHDARLLSQSDLTVESKTRDESTDRSRPAISQKLLDIFRQVSGDEDDRKDSRQPRKLRKKRGMGSEAGDDADTSLEFIGSPTTPGAREVDPMNDLYGSLPIPIVSSAKPWMAAETRRPNSPHYSVQSKASATDASDVEFIDDAAVKEKREKKRIWRFSHSAKTKPVDQQQETARPPMPPSSPAHLRDNEGSQIGTASETGTADTPSDDEEKRRGPMSWIRTKIQERRDEKATKSPIAQEKTRSRRSTLSGGTDRTGENTSRHVSQSNATGLPFSSNEPITSIDEVQSTTGFDMPSSAIPSQNQQKS